MLVKANIHILTLCYHGCIENSVWFDQCFLGSNAFDVTHLESSARITIISNPNKISNTTWLLQLRPGIYD